MKKKKVLIVDDHDDLRKLLRMTIEILGCEIHATHCGNDALAIVPALRPDIVILDVMLPGGIDGLQVCRAIRSDPASQDTHIILVSARGQRSDIAEGRRAGADDYLVKPFSPLELIERVKMVDTSRNCDNMKSG